jgi:hypothetical protein
MLIDARFRPNSRTAISTLPICPTGTGEGSWDSGHFKIHHTNHHDDLMQYEFASSAAIEEQKEMRGHFPAWSTGGFQR